MHDRAAAGRPCSVGRSISEAGGPAECTSPSATVVSRIPGKALLVRVDRAHSGTSPRHALATQAVRAVAAEHGHASVSHALDRKRCRRPVPVSGISSASSRSMAVLPCGDRSNRRRVTERRRRPRPLDSGAPGPGSSAVDDRGVHGVPNTDAPATGQRRSRPDAGLATIPTAGTCTSAEVGGAGREFPPPGTVVSEADSRSRGP
jgi:hypothetical protein